MDTSVIFFGHKYLRLYMIEAIGKTRVTNSIIFLHYSNDPKSTCRRIHLLRRHTCMFNNIPTRDHDNIYDNSK